MWTAIATVAAALLSGVFGLLGKKQAADDGLARVQAGVDADKAAGTSDEALANDPNNLATHPGK